MLYLTCSVIFQLGLERGFRYFKVSPIKASRDICHASVDKVFATGRLTVRQIRGNAGFTLLEVMISLAVVGGLLVTLLYTLNHHLGIAERHAVITLSMGLAKEKLYEMEKKPEEGKGTFPDPYAAFSFETSIKDASFPGFLEISVSVRSGNETVTLSELIRTQQ
jgi:general secretion pathway protein I